MADATLYDHTTLLPFALEWAGWGLPVIPVHVVLTDGSCSCGHPECRPGGRREKNVGKHPCVYHWQDAATTDPETIRQWWVQYPFANIGGMPAKADPPMICIDADGPEGCESIEAYERVHGPLPQTFEAQSGSGLGRHLFFRVPSGGANPTRSNALPKVDTRGEGGQVVLAPSRHRSGGSYRVLHRPPTPADVPQIPPALYAVVTTKSRKKRDFRALAVPPSEVPADAIEIGVRMWRAKVANVCTYLAALDDGRHNATYNAARLLAGHLWLDVDGSLGLERELFDALWVAVGERRENSEPDPTTDTGRAILDGIENGKLAPLDIEAAPDPLVLAEVERVDPKTGKARISPTLGPCCTILSKDSRPPRVRYDQLARRVTWGDPPEQLSDADVLATQRWLEDTYRVPFPKETVRDALYSVAQADQYHPVQDRIRDLAWDGTSRLDRLLTDYFEPPSDAPADAVQTLYPVFGRKFMISLVGRVMCPGIKADSMLILQGRGGVGKSTGLKILAFGSVNGASPWFSDTKLPMDDEKRKYQLLQGKILVERAEFKPDDWEAEKSFLSSAEDKFIPMHAREEVIEPRKCVFCGTTNPGMFLPQADRRAWVVQTASVNVGMLLADRDQLWAEALAAFLAGEANYLETEELETAQLAYSRTFETMTDATADEVDKITDWLDALPANVRTAIETQGIDIEDVLRPNPAPRTKDAPPKPNNGGWSGLGRINRSARKAALRKLGWVERSHPKRWVRP